jgi:hypothetical protein
VVEKSEGAAVAGLLRFVNSPLSSFLFFWACLVVAPAFLYFEPLYDRCDCYIIYSGAKACFERDYPRFKTQVICSVLNAYNTTRHNPTPLVPSGTTC